MKRCNVPRSKIYCLAAAMAGQVAAATRPTQLYSAPCWPSASGQLVGRGRRHGRPSGHGHAANSAL